MKTKTNDETYSVTHKQRYIALVNAVGSMKPGIHHEWCVGNVKVTGPHGSVVFIPQSASRAVIVPSDVVFDTKVEAERYLASKGTLQWCVRRLEGSSKRHHKKRNLVEIFQAHVMKTWNRAYYGRSEWVTIVVPVGSRTPIAEASYYVTLCESKRAAEAFARRFLKESLKEAQRERDAWQEDIVTLHRAQQRLRRSS